jgi:serine/threonine-protein kinase
MSNFDKKRPDLGGPLSAEPASGVVQEELDSGILPRPDPTSKPAPSGARPRQLSAPQLEIGDPITYDPTMEDSYDGVLPGDSSRGLEAPPSEDILPGAVSASLDWSDAKISEISNHETEDEILEDEEEDPYMGATISDRYIIDGVLGEGGMGRVYRAKHKVIGKTVAIKILHSELARDKAAVGRFVREAQAASSVGNPHIVDVADFGETKDGSTYFVMEFLDGPTLAELLEEKESFDADLVCDITLQITDGLEAAHMQEIVHRDLKPDNITFVEQGTNKQFCKILDFGIAKVNTSASSTKLTMAGAVFGTPHYMSPEQAAGAAVDHRTDIYSLGVIMYEMTSGELPFNADNFMGILTQHMYKAPVPIRAMVGAPECSPGLEAVILKCLSKKPDARYSSMQALADDIRKVQSGEVPTAVHDMMARSGGFNVPADYFRASPAPNLPSGKRSKIQPAQIAMFAGIVAAVSLVTFVLLKNNNSDAQVGLSNTPTITNTSPVSSTATAVKVDVMVASNAPAATAWLGEEKFSLPKLFTVTKGKPITLRIVAPRFAEQTIEIHGNQKEVKVHQRAILRPVAKPKDSTSARPPTMPRPIHRPRPNQPGPKPVDGVVDPWGK